MSSGTIQLREYVIGDAGLPDRIDEQAGVIRRAKILGRKSANGREYTAEAVQDAAPRYEGRGVYTDHRTDAGSPRTVRDKFGWFENVQRSADGGLEGDFHYLKAHPMAPVLIEAARRRPDLFGFSHDAVGREKPGSNGTIIESIDEVNSVDLVSDPATVKSLFESRGMSTSAAKNHPKTGTGQRTQKPLRAILTEALSPRAAKKQRSAVTAWLKEMDDFMAPDEPMEATPGASGEDLEAAPPAHGNELMQAICDMIQAALESADSSALDPEYKDKLDAIMDICKSHGKAGGKAGDEDAEEEDTSSQEGKKDKRLSAGERQLREEVRQMKAENTALRLAGEAGIKLTAIQLKALTHLSEAEIKTAIDEHKTALTEAANASRATSTRTRPAAPPSRDAGGRTNVVPVVEKVPTDGKDFLKVLEEISRK